MIGACIWEHSDFVLGNNTKLTMDHPLSVFIVVILFLGHGSGAPTSESGSPSDEPLDGNFLIKLGHQFDNSLLRLIGRVFLNRGVDKIEKKLTDKLCRLHPCTEWGEWGECPVKSGFSMTTRSRVCNKTTDICDFDGQSEYTTTESKVCGRVCPPQYNLTDGFCLKLFTTKVNQADASLSCQKDGGHLVNINSQAKSDVVHALIVSYGKKSDTIWLNGKRSTAGGPWSFTYGTESTFENWHSSEPTNGSKELCQVDENNPRKIFDRSCIDTDYMYICELL